MIASQRYFYLHYTVSITELLQRVGHRIKRFRFSEAL